MNKLLTTKGTNTVAIVSACIGALLDIASFIFFLVILSSNSIRISAGAGMLLMIVWMLFVFDTVRHFAMCQSYVDVYDNRLEGKGVENGFQIKEIRLNYSQITNITYNSINLYIHTPGGKYRILTNAQTAKQVFDLCNRMIGK